MTNRRLSGCRASLFSEIPEVDSVFFLGAGACLRKDFNVVSLCLCVCVLCVCVCVCVRAESYQF